MNEIIDLITNQLGVTQEDAEIWFRNVPLDAFGNKTAKQLVLYGDGDAVRKYIEHLRNGGYA